MSYHYERRTEEVNRLKAVTCDKCGTDCLTEWNNVEALHCAASWGYGSPFDGEHHSFDLCAKCYDEWTVKLGILPKIDCYGGPE